MTVFDYSIFQILVQIIKPNCAKNECKRNVIALEFYSLSVMVACSRYFASKCGYIENNILYCTLSTCECVEVYIKFLIFISFDCVNNFVNLSNNGIILKVEKLLFYILLD